MLRLTLEIILSTNLTKLATWLTQNCTIFYLRQQLRLLIHHWQSFNWSGSWSVILLGFTRQVISSLHIFEAKNPHSNWLYFYTFQSCPFIHPCRTHIGGFIILIILQTSFHQIKTPTLNLLPTRSKEMIWDWKLTQIICTHAHSKFSSLSDIQWKLMEWHNCYRTKRYGGLKIVHKPEIIALWRAPQETVFACIFSKLGASKSLGRVWCTNSIDCEVNHREFFKNKTSVNIAAMIEV